MPQYLFSAARLLLYHIETEKMKRCLSLCVCVSVYICYFTSMLCETMNTTAYSSSHSKSVCPGYIDNKKLIQAQPYHLWRCLFVLMWCMWPARVCLPLSMVNKITNNRPKALHAIYTTHTLPERLPSTNVAFIPYTCRAEKKKNNVYISYVFYCNFASATE